MRQFNLLSSLGSLEKLESKLSPSSLSVGSVAAVALSPLNPEDQGPDQHSLPKPKSPLHADPLDNPPVIYPILPPSGPSGPGS